MVDLEPVRPYRIGAWEGEIVPWWGVVVRGWFPREVTLVEGVTLVVNRARFAGMLVWYGMRRSLEGRAFGKTH
ncbi:MULTISPECIES: hypothetical protein [unclassified Pseudomonas]|uniref:hypothetical protein n=1 Tax=unclassified Pseudomonas TaxID=196821 RepID=UPI000BA47F0C|nr:MULTISPECIES: hypothetical protein [unclassified Pseudomonas]